MASALVIMLTLLAVWNLIDFILMTVVSFKGELIPADMKIVVYFMVKSIAVITACTMSAFHIAQAAGLGGY